MWELPKRHLIQRSMYRQLGTLIAGINPGGTRSTEPHQITLPKLFPDGADVDSEGRPQMLIAGSMGVQAALGETYDGCDIDIFCTWEAAPMVRKRLIERCKMLCAGAMNSGYGMPDILHGTAVVIDHVEGYTPMITKEAAKMFRATQETFCAEAEYNGKVADRHYYNIGLPVGDDAARSFPVDWCLHGEVLVQLIVGKEGSRDARDLLKSFDLAICKTNFDGKHFHIPNPHQTLAAETMVTPARRALIEAFLGHYNDLVTSDLAPHSAETSERRIAATERIDAKVWAAIGAGKVGEGYPADWDVNRTRPGGLGTGMLQHEFIQKLFARMHKYADRGIRIVNPPEGALAHPIEFLDEMSYMM